MTNRHNMNQHWLLKINDNVCKHILFTLTNKIIYVKIMLIFFLKKNSERHLQMLNNISYRNRQFTSHRHKNVWSELSKLFYCSFCS